MNEMLETPSLPIVKAKLLDGDALRLATALDDRLVEILSTAAS